MITLHYLTELNLPNISTACSPLSRWSLQYKVKWFYI